MNPRLGVCSWSLRPGSPEELAAGAAAVGVDAVQLALAPLRAGAWSSAHTAAALADAGIEVRSGMMATCGEDYSSLESIRRTGGVRPDRHWHENLRIARADAALARELGLGLVSFHAGFLPHDARDPERAVLVARLREVVDAFAAEGVEVAFETGQETAQTLLSVLGELERPSAGVNFDPANMILYDVGDPVAALRQLAGHVRQIHVKDAVRTEVPGRWGREVRVGTGQVDWDAFFALVGEAGLACDLMIEREDGEDRVDDMRAAAAVVRARMPAEPGA